MTVEARDIYTCGGCGTKGPDVECGGIYHCPNKFCLAAGAFYLRVQAGYHGDDGDMNEEGYKKMAAECAAEIQATEKRVEILKGCLDRLHKRWQS